VGFCLYWCSVMSLFRRMRPRNWSEWDSDSISMYLRSSLSDVGMSSSWYSRGVSSIISLGWGIGAMFASAFIAWKAFSNACRIRCLSYFPIFGSVFVMRTVIGRQWVFAGLLLNACVGGGISFGIERKRDGIRVYLLMVVHGDALLLAGGDDRVVIFSSIDFAMASNVDDGFAEGVVLVVIWLSVGREKTVMVDETGRRKGNFVKVDLGVWTLVFGCELAISLMSFSMFAV
jgi:hypothetical protein